MDGDGGTGGCRLDWAHWETEKSQLGCDRRNWTGCCKSQKKQLCDRRVNNTASDFVKTRRTREKKKTHCSSPHQTLCHWGCDAAGSSCRTDSGSSNSQTPPLLQTRWSICHSHSAGQCVCMFTAVCSYRSSGGCEPARWPSPAWWVRSWAGACPRTEPAGSARTWLDRPLFPTWQTHSC